MDLRKISNCLKELARNDGADPIAKYAKAHALLGILSEANRDFLTHERDAGVSEVLSRVEMGFRGLCGFVTSLLHDTENDYLHHALVELDEIVSPDGKQLIERVPFQGTAPVRCDAARKLANSSSRLEHARLGRPMHYA